ncbi:MAG: aspartyl/asparaginyl beta-hydroxylase domain-containing protein [Luteimonas sp.]
MKSGGYYDNILSAGPGLDRVKAWLRTFSGESPAPVPLPMQYPAYPCFPGLAHLPFPPAQAAPGALMLESSINMIRSEYLALQDHHLLRYTPPSMEKFWAVYLFSHMGIDTESLTMRCPGTSALIRSLPRVCLGYPWGDALFSIHASDSHLAAHCSVDNLRVRCHLGINIPQGCSIRVGNQTREWQEGRNLLFEDSFEHEVWNRGSTRRAILIVDFWHPDLTDLEIEAITAGFRKKEVRNHFLLERLAMLEHRPEQLVRHIQAQVLAQEDDPVMQRYWR